MMKSKQLFFNRLDELLDCSDSDSGTRYIVRMTSGCANNSEQEGPGLEIPSRGIKRKLAGSSALRFQSPRNKRLKGAANQFISNARLDDQIATSEGNENKDVGYEASTPKILTPAGSVTPEFEPISVSSKHAIRRKRKSAEVDKVTAGAPAQVEEAMNIDEEVFERKGTAASLSAMRLADTYPYTSSAPSSPIEDASAFSAAQRKPPAPQISILDLNMAQAVESAARKAAERTATANKSASMKLLPKRLLLRPVVDPAADQTSIIDNFSTSAPTSPEPRSPSPVPTKSGKSSKSALKPGKVPKTAIKSTAKAKGKQKPEKQSVYDWTIAEQELWITGKKKPDPRLVQFLGGFTIFYVGFDFSSRYMIDDGTSKCIKIILRHGGQVAPTYDPSKVTHVVLAKGVSKAHLLRAAKVKSLTDIPEHIPLLEWRWINALQSMNPDMERGRPPREIRLIPDERLFSYGHFSERLPPVFLHPMGRKQSLKRNASKGSGEISHISQYSADEHDSNKEESDDEQLASRQRAVVNRGLKKSAPSRVPLNLKPILNEISDPLLQCFVEVNQREQYFPQYRNMFDSDTETSDFESNEETLGPKRGGWLCKDPTLRATPCVNEDIIEKLEELKAIHAAKPMDDDKWRVFSLNKAIRALRAHPKRIRSVEEAKKINGIAEKTALKIMEIIDTGDLRRIEFERTEDVLATSVFTKIYGVGQKTAQMWYNNGCRTLDDLRNGKGGVKLNEGQEIGLEFYDDLNTRMPREEAKAIFELIKPIALGIDPDLFVEIMGSYRRGKADCGDIDILITRCPDDGRTHKGVLRQLIDKLHKAGILTEDLALPDYSKPLEAVYHGICRLPNVKGARRRRIDFLTVPWSSKGGALLYYTGDDIFNRSMRLLANKIGYSLNQRGLYAGVVRDPKNRIVKLNTGNLIASETERQIFDKLGVPWREPRERVTYYEDIVKANERKEKKAKEKKG